MEQCPVCGAATRPGAKFCTSCGSRVDEAPKVDATQETQIATPAIETPGETAPDTTSNAPAGENDDRAADTQETSWGIPATTSEDASKDDNETPAWSTSWSGSEAGSTSDPASRFEAALDRKDEAGDDETTTWTWGSSSDAATERDPAADEPGEPATDTAASGWSTPISSMSDDEDDVDEVTTIAASPTDTTDTAGFSASGEVDALSGDESIDEAALLAATPTGDARKRASALLDEARRLIWTIGDEDSATAPDSRSVINNMRRLRGDTADFADLRAVIDAARENPRDIDAVRDLADHAGRLSDLLDSHDRLTGALEEAIGGEA